MAFDVLSGLRECGDMNMLKDMDDHLLLRGIVALLTVLTIVGYVLLSSTYNSQQKQVKSNVPAGDVRPS
jgi:hypothetical protein